MAVHTKFMMWNLFPSSVTSVLEEPVGSTLCTENEGNRFF